MKAFKKEKAQVQDIDRSIYDHVGTTKTEFTVKAGLTESIVRTISQEKNDPKWMLDFRLKALKKYHEMKLPSWGPSLDGLDVDKIITYVRANARKESSWDDVPDDIKNTFEALGIPEAERAGLAGVGAQYDSEIVYHNIQKSVAEQGVVYTDIETALHGEHKDIIKKYFMQVIPEHEHKFAALHGAVWSGGSFVYVPDGVHVDIPLQSYFRFNAAGAGQFEHTLIVLGNNASLHFIEGCSAPQHNVANLHAGAVEVVVGDNSKMRYSTIENWSKNMYNLNTKRAIVGKNSVMEWVSGSFGSHTTCLYPSTILNGEGSHLEYTGISFAGKGQTLDTGAKIQHNAPNTTSRVLSKSISKDGGACTFRSSLGVSPEATGTKTSVTCESLLLDNLSRADTLPVMDIRCDEVDIGHEAKIGRISEDAIYYLMSRGIGEEDAKAMIVSGFAEPISKELPLEYAVEMNNLIQLEMVGSIG